MNDEGLKSSVAVAPADSVNLSAIASHLAFYFAREYPADDAVRALLAPWHDDEDIYFPRGYAERVLVEIGLTHRIQQLADADSIRLYDAASRYDAMVSMREVRDRLASQDALPADVAEAIQSDRESKVWLWKNTTDFERRNLVRRKDGSAQPLHLHEWLKHDTWDVQSAMSLLVGLDPSPSRVITIEGPDSERLLCGWFLDGSVVDMEGWVAANILRDASSKQIELPADAFDSLASLDRPYLWGTRRNLLAVWNSGSHAPRNSPTYYIEWALTKQHDIPWLEWARTEYDIGCAAAEPTSSGEGQPTEANAFDWRESARKIADEFFDRDTVSRVRDSLDGYSKRVMDEMQKREIHGPRGRIDNHKTIQREALQGDKWWAKKTK